MSSFRTADVLALSPKIVLDRIEINGVAAVEADIEKIVYSVWQYADLDDARSDTGGTEIGAATDVLSADCIEAAPVRDAMWGKRDDVGYNCKITLPAASFPAGGKVYRVEMVVHRTAVGADPFHLDPWLLNALASAAD